MKFWPGTDWMPAEDVDPGGSAVVDAAARGAVPGGVIDSAAALELAAAGSTVEAPRTVLLPEGVFRLSRVAVLGRHGVRVKGAGQGRTRLACSTCGGLAFVKPDAAGLGVDAAHWPAVDVATSPTLAGGFTGYRLGGDSKIVLNRGPFDRGPPDYKAWGNSSAFTLSVLLRADGADWGTSATSVLVAAYDLQGRPSPYALLWSGGVLTLYLRTSDGLVRAFGMAAALTTGRVLRADFQVNLAAATAVGWYQRLQVAIDTTGANAGWTAGALKLWPNRNSPVQVGADGHRPSGYGTGVGQTFTCFGLHVRSGVPFAVAGNGSAQQYAAGGAVTDADLVTPDAYTVGLLKMDLPYAAATSILVPWQAGSAAGNVRGWGWFVRGDAGVPDTLQDCGVEGVSIELPAGSHYGDAITLGPVYNFRAADVKSSYGAGLAGSLDYAVSYRTLFRECEALYSADACVFFAGQDAAMEYCKFSSYGRSAVRTSGGEFGNYKPTVSDSNDCTTVFDHEGTTVAYERCAVDFEGNYPQEDYWRVSTGADADAVGVTLDQCQGGAVKDGTRGYVRVETLDYRVGAYAGVYGGIEVRVNAVDSFNRFVGTNSVPPAAVYLVDGPLAVIDPRGYRTPACPQVVNVNYANGSKRLVPDGGGAVPAAAAPASAALFGGATPLFRYRASDLALADGANVTDGLWAAAAGSGPALALAGAGNPTYSLAGLNGHPAVRFTGAARLKLTGFTDASGTVTLFFVLKPTTTDVTNGLFDTAPGQAGDLYFISSKCQLATGGAVSQSVNAPAAQDAPAVLAVRLAAGPPRLLTSWFNLMTQADQVSLSGATALAWNNPTLGQGYVGLVADFAALANPSDAVVLNTMQGLMNLYGLGA